MINCDGSSSSAHKSKCLWVVNPIIIDKSPQPCYRLNPNSYIDLLQPDHLVGVYGGLIQQSVHMTESQAIASRFPKLRTSKGHLVYKRPPARPQLRSQKPILRHAFYNHTRSTHV